MLRALPPADAGRIRPEHDFVLQSPENRQHGLCSGRRNRDRATDRGGHGRASLGSGDPSRHPEDCGPQASGLVHRVCSAGADRPRQEGSGLSALPGVRCGALLFTDRRVLEPESRWADRRVSGSRWRRSCSSFRRGGRRPTAHQGADRTHAAAGARAIARWACGAAPAGWCTGLVVVAALPPGQ